MRLLSTQVKICQIVYVNYETTSRFLLKFSISLQFHGRLFLCSFLAQTIYTLLNRSPLKWKFLRLSSARVKLCQIPYANFEATIWFHSKFCISLQFHERLFLCSFLAQSIYTLLNRSTLKWKFLRLSSGRVKFSPIPYAKFEATSWFLSKFGISLQFHERLFLCTFLAPRIYTLLNGTPLKWKLLRLQVQGSNFLKFLMPIFKQQVNSSPNFAFFFNFMKDNSSILFLAETIAQKESIKMKTFEIFEYSGQNLSDCLCQLWNDKSIPPQILYLSSVSWKTIPLFFFSLNNIYSTQ